jgi:hypothetical protein
VKTGHPKPRSVIAKWERFEAAVKSIDSSLSGAELPDANFHSLFNDDPYAVVKLAVQPAVARKAPGENFYMTPFTADHIIYRAADYNRVDPLLLLAVLADLTGNSPAQDARIAALVKTWKPESNPWRGLENLFARHLRAREQARLLLQKMMTRAKSPELTSAVRELKLPLSPQSASDARPGAGASPTAPAPAAAKQPIRSTPAVVSDAPLYQGVPTEEWQQMFAHETSPAAKLEEAIALVTLAAELSPKDHLAKILDVGAEIVRASFGDDVIDFALADPKSPPTGAPRWQIKKGQNNAADGSVMHLGRRTQTQSPLDPTPREVPYVAFSRFQDLVNQDIHTIPAGLLADDLSVAARSGPSARGAFAASLLRGPAHSVIAESPEASKVVSNQLDVPLKGLDWTALCLIVRLNYVQNDSSAQIRPLTEAIDHLVDRLRAAAVSQTTNAMRSDLLGVLKSEPPEGWPPSVQKTMAELILDLIVREHRRVDEFLSFPAVQWTRFYDPGVVAERRRLVGRLLGPWLTVANGYLKQHTAAPYDVAERQVVAWMYLPLTLYSDGDSWRADETAALLTQQLRAYYSDDPRGTTNQSVEELLPSTPSELLTDIVRVTGEIPDFVKTGFPRSRTVATTRQRFENAVKSRDLRPVQLRSMEQDPSLLSGANQNSLAVDDPYGVVKLAVELAPAGRPKKFEEWFSAQSLLRITTLESSDIDPLLYIAVLTDLAGRNPAWDDNVAELVKNWQPGTDTRVGLEYLVAGHTKASGHARRLLKAFAAKAKSPKLADALRALNAALPSPRG